ncbi:MAG: hypothetical protein IJ781_11090, partial [Atopobiaceae bacterium]|nr:hypothetical protein [Atopobiaceae bacterium]
VDDDDDEDDDYDDYDSYDYYNEGSENGDEDESQVTTERSSYGYSGYDSGSRVSSSPFGHLGSWDTIKLCFKVSVFCVIALLVAAGFFGVTRAIPLGISSDQAVGSQYGEITDALKMHGFSQVNAVAMDDLSYEHLNEEGMVARIQILWGCSFKETTKYPSWLPITVSYHTAKKVEAPLSSKETKGMNYNDVAKAFEDAGFSVVTTQGKGDIIFGVLSKPDTVDSVSIDGDKRFSDGDSYRVDAEVLITYHSKN